jgi:hypothetical protein
MIKKVIENISQFIPKVGGTRWQTFKKQYDYRFHTPHITPQQKHWPRGDALDTL